MGDTVEGRKWAVSIGEMKAWSHHPFIRSRIGKTLTVLPNDTSSPFLASTARGTAC